MLDLVASRGTWARQDPRSSVVGKAMGASKTQGIDAQVLYKIPNHSRGGGCTCFLGILEGEERPKKSSTRKVSIVRNCCAQVAFALNCRSWSLNSEILCSAPPVRIACMSTDSNAPVWQPWAQRLFYRSSLRPSMLRCMTLWHARNSARRHSKLRPKRWWEHQQDLMAPSPLKTGSVRRP